MPDTKKSVAVIGAGPSGLVAIKELLEECHLPTCFEKFDEVGGVYRFSEDSNGVYESAQLTSSVRVTSFSDFPPPDNARFHFYHKEYFQYLLDYTENFKLRPYIQFGRLVKKMQKNEAGRWELFVEEIKTKIVTMYTFDAVAICAGVHQTPLIPNLPQLDLFEGKVHHSGTYKRPDSFKDKNVLVVGGGESGSDIVDEVSKHTKNCYLSLKRGVLVVPRLILGRPNDFYTSRLLYTLPSWLWRIRHFKIHYPSMFLWLLAILLIPLHIFIFERVLFYASYFWFLGLILTLAIGIFAFLILVQVIHYAFFYTNFKEIMTMVHLKSTSQAGHGEQFATKCQGIVKAIVEKRCQLKPNIKQFQAHSVEFVDGTSAQIDDVIFCSGYVFNVPFLSINNLDSRTLYKNCFHPDFGSNLCFIGLSRPAIGAIPPMSEMESRWFSLVLSSKRTLPQKEEMEKAIKEDADNHRKTFAVISDRIPNLVDYTSYMDDLAGKVGCKPKFLDLLKTPGLMFKIYANPFMACQFRLFGPHAKPEVARITFKKASLTPVQLVYSYCLICLVCICELLYKLGFSYFKPNLRL